MAKKQLVAGFKSGFSLLELSIVLAVLSVIMAGILPMLTETTKNRDNEATLSRMKAIDHALAAHRLGHSRLPCPSDITKSISHDDYGREAENDDGSCQSGTLKANYKSGTVVGGGVPVRQLGLPDEYGFDGWGRRFAYHVDSAATDPATYSLAGAITIQDSAGQPKTDDAIFAIISFGPNGHGGYLARSTTPMDTGSSDTDEIDNCGTGNAPCLDSYDAQFVQKMTIPNAFDDIVRYRKREQLDLPAMALGKVNIQYTLIQSDCVSTMECMASCPGGFKIMGGGCNGIGMASTRIQGSFPESESSWKCRQTAMDNIAAYAICAEVE